MEKKVNSAKQKAYFAHLKDERRNCETIEDDLERTRDSLAARLKAGNRAAAVELVDIYYKQIYLFMRRLGHSRQVSEDLTQESFLHAWQHIGQLRSGKALNGWLYRIAGNVSNLHWRRHRNRETVSIEDFDVPDEGENDSDKIERFEQISQMRRAVAKLSRKSRQAIILHYMQQLSIAEAAQAAEVREGAFKSRLNRALKALRKQIISKDGEL